MKFIHLHNHSDYSILDGGVTVDKLIKRAVEFNMPALALTDHGNMFGAIDFYLKAKKAGIAPIIGEEFYVAPESRFIKEKSKNTGDANANHLILLAKNKIGYQNLLKLSSIAYTEGYYYKPRIDMEILEKHSEGLICSSACIAGKIPSLVLKGDIKGARELSGKFNEIFGKDHFYLELQDHGMKEQAITNKELIKISGELNIPLIATNDIHYLKKEDVYSHEVLLCVQTGKTIDDENRMKFPSDQFYMKSMEEMKLLFIDYPDSIGNTHGIFEMIDLELELGSPVLPNFIVPAGFNLDTYLKHLVNEGAKKLYGANLNEKIASRIDYELSVITKMKYSGYFLIIWDLINYARSKTIPVGPGRGSAAGSIVSYCLNITALDPLKYDLLFERFLNPDRNEMPDMDLDFCADRREEVIDYVKLKYGENHVSQIITFNKMTSKAVVKDVARVMNIPFARANEISKLIDKDTLKESIDSSKELKALHKDEEIGKELLDTALKLEGLVRAAGKHAAGVVISKGPITDYVPIYKDPKEGSITSQFDKDMLEKAGLVKMDFLGLRNLTIIDKCLKLIKSNLNRNVDIEKIPLDDEAAFRLLQKADTKGVFQLENSGMQSLLKRIAPTTFEDIIAIVALYRPGPLESGMTEDFVERKRNPSKISYPHPSLEKILKDTLGVAVYQEQVMLISQVMGGFTLPEADRLRKAMGKKIPEIINELESKFLDGAEKNKIDRELAKNVYSMIKKFAEYGFNKSHSAAYALVSYQTAYLKANFKLQYMTALLSAQPDKQEDIIKYTQDCKFNNIAILPPSVNDSCFDFVIESDSIRYGLGAIKGIGSKAIEDIVEARTKTGKFGTLKEFFENVSAITLNRGVLESLMKSGAFDELFPNRAQLFESVDILIDTAKKLQQDRISGQGNLFNADEDENTIIQLNKTEEWAENLKLSNEKEVLGMYLSGHPLSEYENEIRALSSVSISDINEKHKGREVSLIGMIKDLQVKVSQKNGKQYAIGNFEDLSGTLEILFFNSVLKRHEELIMSEEPLLIKGKLESDDEIPNKIIVNSVKTFKEFRRESISAIHIKLSSYRVEDSVLDTLKSAFSNHRGSCPIFFHVNENEEEKIIKVHSAFNILPSENLVKDLSQIVGHESVRYSIGHS